MVKTHELTPVTGEEAGERLDRFVAARLQVPRNRAQGWIRDGRVTVAGEAVTKVSHTVAAGEAVLCSPPPVTEDRVTPEEGPLDILYEDEYLVALNKPPGLVVHPGAGRSSGTLAHRLLAHYPEMAGVGGPGRPGIVHRLDKGTSGVMVAARTGTAYLALTETFARREVEKIYQAVVYGNPTPPRGEIDAAIGRHPQRRKEMTVLPPGHPGARPALSRFQVIDALKGLSRLEVQILTGRTHQIRVHLKHHGNPLVGDNTYGEKRWKGLPGPLQGPLRRFPRPALHAWKLALPHPFTGEPLTLKAPVPEDLETLWSDLKSAQERGGTGLKPTMA